jgi:hypothetical protein
MRTALDQGFELKAPHFCRRVNRSRRGIQPVRIAGADYGAEIVVADSEGVANGIIMKGRSARV